MTPKWKRILETWKDYGGNGLSGHALVNLTGMSWEALKKEMKADVTIDGFKCPDVGAPVFFVGGSSGCPCDGCKGKTRTAYAKTDDLMKEFDPKQYKGIKHMRGHEDWQLARNWRATYAELNNELERTMLAFLDEKE